MSCYFKRSRNQYLLLFTVYYDLYLISIFSTPILDTQVKKVDIHASGPIDERFVKEESNLLEVFRIISMLPNLSQVRIDLDFEISLPLQALIILFQGKNNLSYLHCLNFYFKGSHEEIIELQSLLKTNDCLKHVRFQNCRGSKAVGVLMVCPPALHSIELNNTNISRSQLEANVILASLMKSKYLKSLSLKNIPNFCDDHIKTMALELSLGVHVLKELIITSNVLGKVSAEMLTKMLHFNHTIEKLVLHIDHEDVGYLMAEALQVNTTLKSVSLRIYGDESVTENCIAIARALYSQEPTVCSSLSPLQKLRLCVEVGPRELKKGIISEFKKAVAISDSLKKLRLDDTIDQLHLPKAMRTKLALNRCGVSKLLRSDLAGAPNDNATTNLPSANIHDRLVEAIISERNNLDVIHYILSETPELCVEACKNQKEKKNTVLAKDPCYTTSTGKALETKDRRFRLPQIPTPRAPKIPRKVFSMFAPSA